MKSTYKYTHLALYSYAHFFIYIHILLAIYFNRPYVVNSAIYASITTYFDSRHISIKQLRQYFTKNVLNDHYFVSLWFLRGLSIVYIFAFLGLLFQLSIVQDKGILSYQQFVIQMGGASWRNIFYYPSIFWINQSNLFIDFVIFGGLISSFFSIFKPSITLFSINYVCYLSIVTFGRDVFHFPWDTYLLEIGFLTIALTYFLKKNYLPKILLYGFLLLFFRQWFSMAITKLVDSSIFWTDLTYMKYFWVNQPSPTPISLFLYNLPLEFHKAITFITLILELAIPLLVLLNRKSRIVSFYLSLFLSILIHLSGNFAFFNILTALIGIWCLDDNHFSTFLPSKKENINNKFLVHSISFRLNMSVVFVVVAFNLFYVLLQFKRDECKLTVNNYTNYYFYAHSSPNSLFLKPFFFTGQFLSSFRIVSPHGVFKYIPDKRYYLSFQQSKQHHWVEFYPLSKDKLVRFEAPLINRLRYYLFYQSYGLELRSQLNVNVNSSKLNPTLYELLNSHGLFDVPNSKLRIIRYQVEFDNKQNYDFTPIDTIPINGFNKNAIPPSFLLK